MKKFGKKFLASLLAVAQIITFTPISNLTAFAANTATDGNGTDDLQGISSTFSNGVLTISHIDGKPNSTISSNRLWSDVTDQITKVVIGEGITVVGMGFGNTNADEACKNLTTVELPESLTDISNNAFANCTSLTDVDFSKCTNLKHLNGVKFNSNHTNLSNGDGEKNEFLNCTALTRVDLSNCTKLDRIWSSGFEGCTNLEEVILPSTTQMIGQKTFKDCSKLTTINIPDSLIYISQNAFQADTALTNIDLNKVETIKESAFIESGLTEIDLPDSLTYVEQFAFNQCNNLQKISGGQGIQDNLTNNKKDNTYKHNGESVLCVYSIFLTQTTHDGGPTYPYPEDIFQGHGATKMIYTNVDDAVDCIKYGNWRMAYRYQFKLRFIDATHTIFDTDKVFDGYTGYFDYYNDTVKAADVNNQISNVPVKYEKANAAFVHYYRDENYAVHTKDGKTYTPSDKWTSGKTGPEVDLTKDTQILSDIDYYLTKYDTDTVTHTVKFKNIKGKDTVEQTYNDGEHLTNIPTDLNYSDTNYNYIFKGWSTTTSEDDIVNVDETVTVTEDKEYYAIYEQTDKLTLKYVYTTMTNDNPDCDNPFSLDSTKYLKDERDYDNAAVGQKLGSTYEDAPATLTKDDKTYDFVGWYAYYYTGNGGFKTITINADTKISKDNISTDRHNGNSIVYYAIYKYNPKKYMVSFINEDNTSENKSGEVESGNTYANTYNGFDDNSVDDFVPRSDGKTFTGWKVNDTDEIVTTDEAKNRVITQDTTFKAVFKAEPKTIGFYVAYLNDNNSVDSVNIHSGISVEVGSKIDFPAMDAKKTDSGTKYVFKGFIKGQADSDTDMTTAEYVDTTNYICKSDSEAFTAVYEPEKCTVRYIGKDSNGEDTVFDTVTITADESMMLSDDSIITNKSYTKDGKKYDYEYYKWYKNNNDDEKYNYNASITITEDTDFYVHYKEVEAKTYTITLKNDDNSVIETFKVVENQPFSYSAIPTSKNDPSGKEFTKWRDEDYDYWDAPISIDSVTQDKTFTARYEDKTVVNLTFRFFDADNAPIKTSTVMQLSTTFADIPKPDSNPTKEGYTFKGWRAETDIVKDSDVFNEDTDFYPVFEENAPTEYTLRFFLQTEHGNYVWKTDKVKAGDSYTLPTRDEVNPLRFETTDGKTYEFLRWTKKGSAAYLDAVITPTSDMDFYADYREIHFYTVTLLNDDNSVITTQKVESSNYFTYDSKPTSNVNAEDKYFGYWKRTEGTSGNNYEYNNLNIKVYDNVTYQAIYYDVPYVTIKFVDAERNELNSVTMKKGNKITASDIPTKKANGNDILGWRFGITNDDILNRTFDTDKTYEAVPNITFKKKDGSTIKTVAATFNREKDYYDATQVEVPSDISRWTLDGTEYTSSDITDGEHIKNIKKDLVFEEAVAVQPTIKIIFVDDDETTVLKTEKVYALGILFNQLDAPSVSNKEDDVYTYTFKGWRVKGETDLVNESRGFNTDTTLVAVYDKVAKPVTPVEPEKVTARFINWNNAELDSKEVAKGTTLGEIVIDTPSRDEDDNFTYTFKAWTVNNNEVDNSYVINEDTTFKATYTSTPKQTTPVDPDPDVTVTVTFKPENGETDTVKTDVVSGSALGTVKIADPVKAEDDKFTYTFAGWKLEENDAVVDDSYVINKDTVFIATYTATKKDKTYHVIFKDEDGTTIDEKDVPTNTPLGDIKPNDPSKEGKDFKGWDDGTGVKPDDTPITKDTTFTATYEPKELPPTPTEPEKVTVIFKDYDGTTIEEKQVNKNSFLGTVKPENPTRTDYKFVGWSKDDVVRDDGFIITEDTVFIATYVTKEIKLIQIDGTLLDKDGKPIANAVVTLHSTVRQTTTDENGYYIFKNVELEEHEVNAKVENTEVYKYNIDATDVENIKKVLESQDANYDVNSNISEKNGVVTITLNAKEKGNETPAPSPVEPTPTPTPDPTPTPTPVQPKETVTIKFYLDYDLTELFDTVVVNKGEAFTYNKEPEGYKFWINVDQYAENRVYHNGETIYPMKDMTFYMEKEVIDTPDDSEVIDKPTDEPKNDDTPIKDNPKDNKDVPTPKDNKDKDKPKDKKDNPKEDKEKKEDRDIPKTGDSILIYVLGLIAGLAMLKKKKEND